MIESQTYAALRPSFLLLLDLGAEAEEMRLSQLLILYAADLPIALGKHLDAYTTREQELLDVATADGITLNAAATELATPEGAALREALKIALGHIFFELPAYKDVHEQFLKTLNPLRGPLRFGLLLAAICTFLPTVLAPENVTIQNARLLNDLLQKNAKSIHALLSVRG